MLFWGERGLKQPSSRVHSFWHLFVCSLGAYFPAYFELFMPCRNHFTPMFVLPLRERWTYTIIKHRPLGSRQRLFPLSSFSRSVSYRSKTPPCHSAKSSTAGTEHRVSLNLMSTDRQPRNQCYSRRLTPDPSSSRFFSHSRAIKHVLHCCAVSRCGASEGIRTLKKNTRMEIWCPAIGLHSQSFH